MTRKRKDLDIGEKKGKKKGDLIPFEKKGGFPAGQSGNPDGKAVGTLSGATRLMNKQKEALIQAWKDAGSVAMFKAMFKGQVPWQFLTPDFRRRYKNNQLTEDEWEWLVRMALKLFMWSQEWMGKQFPKTLAMTGEVLHEHTVAGMTKIAETKSKSPNVLDMVRKKDEDGAFEVEEDRQGEEEEDE